MRRPLPRRSVLPLVAVPLALPLLLRAAPAEAALTSEQATGVRRLEDYFSAIQTLAATFTQVAPDNGMSTGKLFIDRDRPGMRFDYDPPSKILLVAPGDWRVIFYDGTIKQVNVIPLSETPLGFLFQTPVHLSGDVTVVDLRERPDEVDLTLVRSAAPDQGRVTLTLTREPLALSRWTVVDAQGGVTRLLMSDIKVNQPIDPKLFVWRDPQLFGWPQD